MNKIKLVGNEVDMDEVSKGMSEGLMAIPTTTFDLEDYMEVLQ